MTEVLAIYVTEAQATARSSVASVLNKLFIDDIEIVACCDRWPLKLYEFTHGVKVKELYIITALHVAHKYTNTNKI